MVPPNDRSYFNAEIGNEPAIDAFVRQGLPEPTIRTGKLHLATPIMLGDIVLPPGNYEFRQVQSGEQQLVEFSQIVTNNYAPVGRSVYERQVVARVNATPEALAIVNPQTTSPTTGSLTASAAGK